MDDKEKISDLKENPDNMENIENSGDNNKDLPEDATKQKFKKHSAFSKKRPANLRGVRQSKDNPYLNTLNQHERNKMRVAKIIFVIFGIIILTALGVYFYEEWQKEQQRIEALNAITQRLNELDNRISQSKSYERNKLALAAISYTERAVAQDPKSYRNWIVRKAKYIDIISKSSPELNEANGQNFINPTVLTDMVHIPAGHFYMGKGANEPGRSDELPRHSVVIPKEFWICRTEVSNFQFRRLFPNHKTKRWRGYRIDLSTQPVVKVNWHIASAFCQMVTDREDQDGRLPDEYEYRLPTEAEWEYACRAGTSTRYYWGDKFGNTGGKYANAIDLYSIRLGVFKIAPERDMAANDGQRVSAPANAYKRNAFGLCNTLGNVSEWCYDWYYEKAYRELAEVAPVQIQPVVTRIEKRASFDSGLYVVESTCKVLRGGNYGNVPRACRAARRDFAEPETKNTAIGFRMVLAPVIKKSK